ncbi:MAG: tripartite tricarboxylate transporter permease [Rhodospirillaceae bacterium]
MDSLLSALGLVATFPTLAATIAGTLLGIVMGVLPGLGPGLALSLALPFTFSLDKMPSLGMLLGLYCGSIYGGSITAILINTPGTPASAATCLDGYPMARAGHADRAIGLATLASFFGGLFSLAVLVLAAPLLASWALKFGPAEIFAIAVFALTCIASVSEGALIKGLMAGIIGLFISVIGQDAITGEARFTFGVFELTGGISLVPVLVGLFALSEVMVRLTGKHGSVQPIATGVGFRLPGLATMRRCAGTAVKGSVIGTLLGVLPGVGPTTASFVSYSEARRGASKDERFGQGEPKGIVASESANNAVSGGALVPTLALGIPGDPITAILLGAFVIHEIVPGPRMFVQHLDLVQAIFITLLLVNIVMFAAAAASAQIWTRVLRVPEPLLMAGVVVMVAVGTFSVNNSLLDLGIAFIAGLVGFLLRYNGFPTAPVVIGLVLGRMVEESLRMGLIAYDGSFATFFGRPIPIVIYAATILVLLWPLYARRLARRRAAAD